MKPERAFRSRLIATPAVVALLAQRIYQNRAPEQTEKPYAVFDRISTVRSLTHNGTSDLHTVRMQIDVYGTGADQARAAADAVTDALHPQKWVDGDTTVQLCVLDNDQTSYFPDAQLHRVALDFIVTCSPTE